jgi:hypothetical protein
MMMKTQAIGMMIQAAITQRGSFIEDTAGSRRAGT